MAPTMIERARIGGIMALAAGLPIVATMPATALVLTGTATIADVSHDISDPRGGFGDTRQTSDAQFFMDARAQQSYPVFTPPGGQPFDTGFTPAHLEARQAAIGFNSVSVVGGFASSLAHRLTATADLQITAMANVGETPAFHYFVFPATLGAACFGASQLQDCHLGAGFKASFDVTVTASIGDFFSRITIPVFRTGASLEVQLDPATGAVTTVLSTRGTALPSRIDAKPTATFGDPDLLVSFAGYEADFQYGTIQPFMTYLTLDYTMTAEIDVPANGEQAALAQVADPFGFGSDPAAYARSVFGTAAGLPGFGVAAPLAAPEPPGLALLLAPLAAAAARWRSKL